MRLSALYKHCARRLGSNQEGHLVAAGGISAGLHGAALRCVHACVRAGQPSPAGVVEVAAARAAVLPRHGPVGNGDARCLSPLAWHLLHSACRQCHQ